MRRRAVAARKAARPSAALHPPRQVAWQDLAGPWLCVRRAAETGKCQSSRASLTDPPGTSHTARGQEGSWCWWRLGFASGFTYVPRGPRHLRPRTVRLPGHTHTAFVDPEEGRVPGLLCCAVPCCAQVTYTSDQLDELALLFTLAKVLFVGGALSAAARLCDLVEPLRRWVGG